jgi:hypothetical protein
VQASGVTYLPPVVALLIGTLLGGESLRPLDVIAMSAILGGVSVMLGFRAGGTPQSTASRIAEKAVWQLRAANEIANSDGTMRYRPNFRRNPALTCIWPGDKITLADYEVGGERGIRTPGSGE